MFFFFLSITCCGVHKASDLINSNMIENCLYVLYSSSLGLWLLRKTLNNSLLWVATHQTGFIFVQPVASQPLKTVVHFKIFRTSSVAQLQFEPTINCIKVE